MFRREMPRVYELKDLIKDQDNPRAEFPFFRSDDPLRREAWLMYEREFQQLDALNWQDLKDEARPRLNAFNWGNRDMQQIISILNQARAYNYLIGIGCSHVRFIPRAKQDGLETPDLRGELTGQKVLCEVKTVHISNEEVRRRKEGGASPPTNYLHDNFLNEKLKPTLCKAKSQMQSYQMKNFHESDIVKCIAFIVINFDTFGSNRKPEYYSQIDQWLATEFLSGIDIVFYNQVSINNALVSMTRAQVINQAFDVAE